MDLLSLDQDIVPVELDKCHFDLEYTLNVDCWPLVFASFRELCISNLPTEINSNMTSSLANLKKISLKKVTFEWMEVLVSHLPKLTTIKTLAIKKIGAHINLKKWNRQRERLAQPKRVLIHVNEKAYLSIKWANGNHLYNTDLLY